MSTATALNSIFQGEAPGASTLATIRSNYAAWRLFRRTRNELMSLSNRELADLGIARANIHSVAYEAAYGA